MDLLSSQDCGMTIYGHVTIYAIHHLNFLDFNKNTSKAKHQIK